MRIDKKMWGIKENKFDGAPSTWSLELRYVGVATYRGTFASKKDAIRSRDEIAPKMRAEARAARLASRVVAPKLTARETFDGTIVAELVDQYVKSREGSGWSGHLETVKAAVGETTRIDEIIPSWAIAYVDKMRSATSQRKKPFGYATIGKHFKLIAAAVSDKAFRMDVTGPALPFSTRRLFPKNWKKSRTRRLKSGEEQALRDAIASFRSPTRPHWGPLLTIAIETAARLQEMVLAEWSAFDMGRRVWNIPAENVKTDQAREVPLSKAATETLLALQAARDPADPRVFHLLGDPAAVSKQFRESIVPKAGLKDYKFHDNRHEGITRMRSKGSKLDFDEVMRIVGHHSMASTAVYNHAPVEDMVDSMD